MATLAQAHVFTATDEGSGVVQTNECQACTLCNFQVSKSGTYPEPVPLNYNAFVWLLTGVCPEADREVQIIWNSFSLVKNRFVVEADDVSIYDSGCNTGSGSANFDIPAGTAKVKLIVYGRCEVPVPEDFDQWSVSLGCTS